MHYQGYNLKVLANTKDYPNENERTMAQMCVCIYIYVYIVVNQTRAPQLAVGENPNNKHPRVYMSFTNNAYIHDCIFNHSALFVA